MCVYIESFNLGNLFLVLFLGKPKPDIYLELVRRLNINGKSCVVFEDSPSGITSAVTAGLKCIGILSSLSKETLEKYGTWKTVKNFDEINLDQILSELEPTEHQ